MGSGSSRDPLEAVETPLKRQHPLGAGWTPEKQQGSPESNRHSLKGAGDPLEGARTHWEWQGPSGSSTDLLEAAGTP